MESCVAIKEAACRAACCGSNRTVGLLLLGERGVVEVVGGGLERQGWGGGGAGKGVTGVSGVSGHRVQKYPLHWRQWCL